MAAIPAYALRAHPKVDGGARSVFFEDAAVPLSIPGKNLWEGALILGADGEGTAALFVQFDGRNTVEDVRWGRVPLTGRPQRADKHSSA